MAKMRLGTFGIVSFFRDLGFFEFVFGWTFSGNSAGRRFRLIDAAAQETGCVQVEIE